MGGGLHLTIAVVGSAEGKRVSGIINRWERRESEPHIIDLMLRKNKGVERRKNA